MSLEQNTTGLQEILAQANALPDAGSGGVELPELTNPAAASQVLEGTQVIDQDGKVMDGTMPDNGTIAATFDGITAKSYDVPMGFTGGGTVQLDDTIDIAADEQTAIIQQISNVLLLKSAPGVGIVFDSSYTVTDDGNGNVVVQKEAG